MSVHLVVARSDLRQLLRQEAAREDLRPGQARLNVDLFALTANNITYGVYGDRLGYWAAFPASQGFGRIPVWGFATVAETTDPRLTPGERIYGLAPMSSSVVIDVGVVKPHLVTDAAPHRTKLAPIYNQYMRQNGDTGVAKLQAAGATAVSAREWETEAWTALLRPLFTTGFLLDQHVAAHPEWGADQLIVTSASSKTALSLAAGAKARGAVRVVGLTAPGNVRFAARTGYYDHVATYNDVEALAAARSVLVDIAGDPAIVRRVHAHLAGGLIRSILVGGAHWQAPPDPGAAFIGPRPEFFFAPAVIEEQVAAWGAAGFQERLAAAWGTFLADAPRWLTIRWLDGWEAIEAGYLDLIAGAIGPDTGLVAVPPSA